jgi:hypothetical protein
MISQEILSLAKKLWDYHLLNNRLEKVDCILALGSHDLRVPERAAELYLKGFAPLLICLVALEILRRKYGVKKKRINLPQLQ